MRDDGSNRGHQLGDKHVIGLFYSFRRMVSCKVGLAHSAV